MRPDRPAVRESADDLDIQEILMELDEGWEAWREVMGDAMFAAKTGAWAGGPDDTLSPHLAGRGAGQPGVYDSLGALNDGWQGSLDRFTQAL